MNYIKIYENSLDKKKCEELITLFEESNKKREGITSNGLNKQVKNTMDLHSINWNNRYLDDIVYKELNLKLVDYYQYINRTHLFIPYTNIIDTGYQIQKYIKNEGFYKYHNDFCANSNDFRILTFLWYLNDVDEGGETEFENILIKPKTGTLVIFPATWTYPHRGNMPISNDKYIMTGWIYQKTKLK